MLNIHEDELVLMIAKNNEEALGLLFSIYEKKMRFEAVSFERSNKNIMNRDDYYQEMKITLYKILSSYDYKKGKLYTFWLSIYKYPFYNLKNNFESVTFYDETFESEDAKDQINNRIKHFDAEILLNTLKKEDEQRYLIMKKWSEGYKYEEIAKMFDISISSVNYNIKIGIRFLKDKMQ